MYYNIKIKSNGSEFSLETTNKEVTQREMDLYFAEIFDVSDDFKSKIKKVEIYDENVVSITQLEKMIEDNTPLPSSKIKEVQPKIEKEENTDELHFVKDEDLNKTTIKKEDTISQTNTTEILTKPLEFHKATKSYSKDYSQIADQTLHFNSIPKQEEKTDASQEDNLEELIDMAKEQLNSIDIIQNRTTETISIQNDSTVPVAYKIDNKIPEATRYVRTPLVFKDEVKENTKNKDELVNFNNSNEVQTIKEEDNFNFCENNPQISLAEIETSLQQEEETPFNDNFSFQIETPTVMNYRDNSFSNFLNTPTQSKNEKPTEEELINTITEEITEAIKENLGQKDNSDIQLDFQKYLEQYNCNDLTDQFLICAYYIKNVLKEHSFTMKYINSKLFQAVEKIADLSIVDELLNKRYIKVVETEISKKYAIAPDGENYFINNYQG